MNKSKKKRRPKKLLAPPRGSAKARNSKEPGESYDGDIWRDIVSVFTKEHGINEYDFNRIICFCFPAWGVRNNIDAFPKLNRECKLAMAEGKKWVYSLYSKSILDSLMSWKEFKKRVDQAIKFMKPKLSRYDQYYSAVRNGVIPRKEIENSDDPIPPSSEEGEDPLDYSTNLTEATEEEQANINNLLYGEYDDDTKE